MFQGSECVTSMRRVRLTVLEPLYGHERSTYYIQSVDAHLKSVPLEKVAELRGR
jgi:hypothetical protein